MSVNIILANKIEEGVSTLFICSDLSRLKGSVISERELNYIIKKRSEDPKADFFLFDSLGRIAAVIIPSATDSLNDRKETIRRRAARVAAKLQEEQIYKVSLADLSGEPQLLMALAEGLALASYSFLKYKTDKKDRPELEIAIVSDKISQAEITTLKNLLKAVFLTRDLVNEPVGYLSAEKLGELILETAQDYGFSAQVFNKKKIESLKMGGLLAVNKGSIDPPTFSVLEWKPAKTVNSKPIVLVGKGVVFDTGGINLKTPPGSLDTMKCDMSGAAAVIGTMAALAANKVPLHVLGLIPATDNRPGGNALVPGDIITMHSGATVEVINTDAEGRLILADALSFAKRYEPELVIDLATLTGNAVVAIGTHGSVAMGTASPDIQQKLSEAGDKVCERLAWFPFWKDYDDAIKSEIADMKNLGGREGGAITAGKFLAKFVDAPWVHLDIAGPAFLEKKENYRGLGGTGVGVRLLYRFLETYKS
ncbi:MAG: leucyl aminopeptidase [Bacteroidales bacterium]|jgi:leucyl aminopeptidase|nr:leucyl aminopeptidase [Bacteroidales bacterium]